jgi:hypothetical protein
MTFFTGLCLADPGFSNDWWGRDPIEQAEAIEADIEEWVERARELEAEAAESARRAFESLTGKRSNIAKRLPKVQRSIT